MKIIISAKNVSCIIFILLLVSSTVAFSQEQKNSFENILLKINSGKMLSSDDLDSITSKEQLRLLRNAVYARHGYIFKSSELTAYFSKFSWYTAKRNSVQQLLSVADKQNVTDIQYRECALQFDAIVSYKKSNKYAIRKDEIPLVGIWQNAPVMAAGWSESYAIYPNHIIVYRTSQMDSLNRLILKIGSWQLDNGVMRIEYFKKQIIVGGEILDEPPYPEIINATVSIVDISPKENEIISLKKILDENFPQKEAYLWGTVRYYRMTTDPTDYN